MRFHRFYPLTLIMLALIHSVHAQTNYQRLKVFGYPEISASGLKSLVIGKDRRLYGITQQGGKYNSGVIFRMENDGTGYVVLRHFTFFDGAGQDRVIAIGDDVIYGISDGIAFKVQLSSRLYTVLHKFTSLKGCCANPREILLGGDSFLYGSTAAEDRFDGGTIFRLSSDGTDFTVLHRFAPTDLEVSPDHPRSLITGADGTLFGLVGAGVFRLNRDGTGFQVIHRLNSQDGYNRHLLGLLNGLLYGTIGTKQESRIFTISPDGTGYTALRQIAGDAKLLAISPGGGLYGATFFSDGIVSKTALFKLNSDGTGYRDIHTWGSIYKVILVADEDGMHYWATDEFFGEGTRITLFRMDADGENYSDLRQLTPTGGDGTYPRSDLVVGNDGALYGATPFGGANDAGTVFKLSVDGTAYSIIYHFSGNLDGGQPEAGLLDTADGTLYGTTSTGGAFGYGTIFKLSSDGTVYKVLHPFSGGDDGGNPRTHLVLGGDGVLYGTTAPSPSISPTNLATIFRINSNGSGYRVLHTSAPSRRFVNEWEENYFSPRFELLATAEMLYITDFGGRIFKMNTDGTGYAMLHQFNEDNPEAGLILGADGFLHGTTRRGGTNDSGTIFKLQTNGTGYAVLHHFGSLLGDGIEPQARLLQGRDNSLYGTTYQGGATGGGIAFKINPDGSDYTILHTFGRVFSWEPLVFDGSHPLGGLTLASDGSVYGVTGQGGESGFGTVFHLFSGPPHIFFTGIDSQESGIRLSLAGGAGGQSFQVQSSADFREDSWASVAGGQFLIDGRAQALFAPMPSSRRFYRLLLP